MQNIRLDCRLAAVASLVRRNSRLADIGTDHGYIPVYLVNEGIINEAVASDINEGPLKNAYNNISLFGLCDKITTVLSNGLESLDENCADDIIIAGMGGILISEILEKCKWIKSKNIRIIAQPMTHAEKVREYFINNGFTIKEEKAVEDTKHTYCIIAAEYEGVKEIYTDGYIYYGELIRNKDVVSVKYLTIIRDRLMKRYNALLKCEAENVECNDLFNIISELNDVLEKMK